MSQLIQAEGSLFRLRWRRTGNRGESDPICPIHQMVQLRQGARGTQHRRTGDSRRGIQKKDASRQRRGNRSSRPARNTAPHRWSSILHIHKVLTGMHLPSGPQISGRCSYPIDYPDAANRKLKIIQGLTQGLQYDARGRAPRTYFGMNYFRDYTVGTFSCIIPRPATYRMRPRLGDLNFAADRRSIRIRRADLHRIGTDRDPGK